MAHVLAKNYSAFIKPYPNYNPNATIKVTDSKTGLTKVVIGGLVENDYTQKIWECWQIIDNSLSTADTFTSELRVALAQFGQWVTTIYGHAAVTPYMHIVCEHTEELIDKFGCLSRLSQQGFEHCHKRHKKIWAEASSQHHAAATKQVFFHALRDTCLFYFQDEKFP